MQSHNLSLKTKFNLPRLRYLLIYLDFSFDVSCLLSYLSFNMSFNVSCLLSIYFLDFVFAFPTPYYMDKISILFLQRLRNCSQAIHLGSMNIGFGTMQYLNPVFFHLMVVSIAPKMCRDKYVLKTFAVGMETQR